MRAYIDGSNDITWLSCGTEDFFLPAYHFPCTTRRCGSDLSKQSGTSECVQVFGK